MTGTPTPLSRRPSPPRHRRLRAAVLAFLLAAPVPGATAQAQSCNPYQLSLPKGQALYLLFPTTDVSFTHDSETYDVAEFNVHDLDPTIGSTSMLRTLVYDLVQDVFCELSVDVQMVTTVPTPTEDRWQIAGIGSDEDDSDAFGRSYGTDPGDLEAKDVSRIWAKEFLDKYGMYPSGEGPLQNANSTLLRWARTIGNTAAHEAAHNYGAQHGFAPPQPGTSEDSSIHHLMSAGLDLGATLTDRGHNRANQVRHFSDTNLEVLAHDIGLNTKMVSNWDFTNPNDVPATRLTMRVLTLLPSLQIATVFDGGLSPWAAPSLTLLPNSVMFQGKPHFDWELQWEVDKSWDNGPPGEVPPGRAFHVGVGLDGPHVLRSVVLGDDAGPLALQPRMVGYSSGSSSSLSNFQIVLWELDDSMASEDFTVSDMKVDFLPRGLSIDSMMVDTGMFSALGLPVEPFSRQPGRSERPGEVVSQLSDLPLDDFPVAVTVARASDLRHVDVTHDATGCEPGIVGEEGGFTSWEADAEVEVVYCPQGTSLSLFPATYTYAVLTLVDPEAYHWDAAAGGFVTGPLESRLFVQFAGTVPDANGNGVDDLLDVRSGTSRDGDGDGVPDEAQGGGR